MANMSGEPALSPRESVGSLSSSSPVVPSSSEQNYLKLSAGLAILGDPQPLYLNPYSSNSGLAGHMLSSSTYSTDIQISSAHQDKDTRTAQYTTASSLPFAHSTNLDVIQFGASSHGSDANTSFRWCSSLSSDFQDFPTEASPKKSRLCSCNGGTIGHYLQNDFVRGNDWHDWVDKLIAEEEDLNSSFSDLLVDTTYPDHESKMSNQAPEKPRNCPSQQMQCQQKISVSTSQVNASVDSSSSLAASPIKHHMRWTPELHDDFVDAINKLGGSERANPKDVLKLMKVDGLTIYHVKSHLQKYRTARYMTESKEGLSDKKSSPLLDLINLDYKGSMNTTEALRLQMQVQKKLHEQLQIQRNLQIQIEKQGKYLQMMSEKQCKPDINNHKATCEFEEEPCSNTADAFQTSHANYNQEMLSAKKTLLAATDKDKRPRKDDLFDNQPSKLAKVYNPTMTSSD